MQNVSTFSVRPSTKKVGKKCVDYTPFGMAMPGRDKSVNPYRYGYNGMEIDPEMKGKGNEYTTEFRQYDPRVGRWMSLDPLMMQFPWMSPYCAFDNNPVLLTDPRGLSTIEGDVDDNYVIKNDGSIICQKTDDKFDVFYTEDDQGVLNEIARLDKNDKGLVPMPDKVKGDDFEINYRGSDNENFMSPAAFVSLCAAAKKAGVSDLSSNHWSNPDGSSQYPSTSHIDGKNGDLKPLRTDETGGRVLVTDPEFDKERNKGLIAALRLYGWNKILSARNNEGYITPGTTHYMGRYNKKGKWIVSDHRNHFHLQGFKSTIRIVTELDVPGNIIELEPVIISAPRLMGPITEEASKAQQLRKFTPAL
jgi:RHS repeat-associated protein